MYAPMPYLKQHHTCNCNNALLWRQQQSAHAAPSPYPMTPTRTTPPNPQLTQIAAATQCKCIHMLKTASRDMHSSAHVEHNTCIRSVVHGKDKADSRADPEGWTGHPCTCFFASFKKQSRQQSPIPSPHITCITRAHVCTKCARLQQPSSENSVLPGAYANSTACGPHVRVFGDCTSQQQRALHVQRA
jgi:hypothetical protein